MGAQSFAADLLGEGAGEIGLADAGRSGDQAVLAVANPLAGGEREDERAVEAAGCAEVEILQGRLLTMARLAEAQSKLVVLPFGGFAVHQEAQPLLEGELTNFRHPHLFFERAGAGGFQTFCADLLA